MEQIELDRSLFNIDPLVISDKQALLMGEVTSLSIFEANSQVFDPKGLFSTEIFGPVGSTLRLDKPGYINLKIPILHPLTYIHLTSLSSQYDRILSGKLKVRYDADAGEFVEDKDGGTGFNFFMQYLPYLDLKENTSKERSDKIAYVRGTISKDYWWTRLFVLPAGLRDYGIDAKGRAVQDEINDLYRKVLTTVNMIRNNIVKEDEYKQFDIVRYKLQNIVADIFLYCYKILDGKSGFFQGKWARRAIMDGTRNVLTGSVAGVKDLKQNRKVSYNHTIVGLYQYIKAMPSHAMHNIHKYFILGLMNPYTNNVKVIDAKTKLTTLKTVSPKVKDAWLTRTGLNNIFNKFQQDLVKNDYAKIGDDYVALIDIQGDKCYVIKDTNNVPEGAKLATARPITYAELAYIAIAGTVEEARCVVTRYPITGVGSIYPSRVYLKTTVLGKELTCYLDDYVIDLPEFPVEGQKFFNSISVSQSKLGVLGGDYDGDVVSFSLLQTEESKIEIDKRLTSKDFYISTDGSLMYSINTIPLDLVVKHLSD